MDKRKKMERLSIFAVCSAIIALFLIMLSCNNPFSTRTPVYNPNPSDVAIKPANSPENVLYNLRVTFENLSLQDYLNVFSEDFVFNPDPEDSIRYENDFRLTWNKERETDFANNFFLSVSSDTLYNSSVYLKHFIEFYKPGQDMYECNYVMEVVERENEWTIRGRAWLFLKEYPDGKWYIYQWVDHKVQQTTMTWGVLRRYYI